MSVGQQGVNASKGEGIAAVRTGESERGAVLKPERGVEGGMEMSVMRGL